MTLTGKKVTEINKAYLNEVSIRCRTNKLSLNVGTNDYWNDSVFTRNWQVCKIDDIDNMIKELTLLKEVIEDTLGVIIK